MLIIQGRKCNQRILPLAFFGLLFTTVPGSPASLAMNNKTDPMQASGGDKPSIQIDQSHRGARKLIELPNGKVER